MGHKSAYKWARRLNKAILKPGDSPGLENSTYFRFQSTHPSLGGQKGPYGPIVYWAYFKLFGAFKGLMDPLEAKWRLFSHLFESAVANLLENGVLVA